MESSFDNPAGKYSSKNSQLFAHRSEEIEFFQTKITLLQDVSLVIDWGSFAT